MKITIIYNPTAGRQKLKQLRIIMEILVQHGAILTLLETGERGDAERFAADFARAPDGRLAVAGGDGTINEVINGLMLGGGESEPVSLGIIPIGTVNVLAREIHQKFDPMSIAQTLLFGTPHGISIGSMGKRYFVLMAGAGFDAAVVDGVNLTLKRFVGSLAYAWAALKTFLIGGLPRHQVTVDGVGYEVSSVVVSNVKRYGGDTFIAPEANLRDGQFDICLMMSGSRRSILAYAWAFLTNRVSSARNVEFVKGQSVEITPMGRSDSPLQVDGDPSDPTPIKLRVVPEAISLLHPSD